MGNTGPEWPKAVFRNSEWRRRLLKNYNIYENWIYKTIVINGKGEKRESKIILKNRHVSRTMVRDELRGPATGKPFTSSFRIA